MHLYLQALAAINEVSNEIYSGSPDFFPIKPSDYHRYLVLSLGTGTAKREEKYSAEMAAKWGILGWLSCGGSSPLIDVFTHASSDMVDFHLSTVFKALHCENNYIRIQVRIIFIYYTYYFCLKTIFIIFVLVCFIRSNIFTFHIFFNKKFIILLFLTHDVYNFPFNFFYFFFFFSVHPSIFIHISVTLSIYY